jgi:hypothetical protein
MALSNAERQARYRERHRLDSEPPAPKAERDATPLVVAQRRIAALEEEVRHLKAELARRMPSTAPSPQRDPFREFRPVPKPSSRSRSRTSVGGRAG